MDIKIFKTESIKGTISAPPSKSYTHRAIFMASIANGTSIIRNPLISGDTNASIEACRAFGAQIKINNSSLKIDGLFPFKQTKNLIDVQNSGTTLRIITPLASLIPGKTTITGDKSILKRPMGPLIDSLLQLGVNIYSEKNNSRPPIIVNGPSLSGGITTIPGNISSQFITGLLIATPLAINDTTIVIKPPIISKPYILITLEYLELYNISIKYQPDLSKFYIKGRQTYSPTTFSIPGDFSSASFILALAAITNSTVTINNLDPNSFQGDKQILDILKTMGCKLKIDSKNKSVTFLNSNSLSGIDLNMSNIPDLFPVVCAVASFAAGKTRLYGAQHLKFKESNRITSIVSELSKLNINIRELSDGAEIIGPNKLIPHNNLNTYNDHRIAMILAILATQTEQMIIPNIELAEISYPNFLNHLKTLGVNFEVA